VANALTQARFRRYLTDSTGIPGGLMRLRRYPQSVRKERKLAQAEVERVQL
jgi:hypothetical protein